MPNDVATHTLDLTAIRAEVERRVMEGPETCRIRDGRGPSHLRLHLDDVLGVNVVVHWDGRCVLTMPRTKDDGRLLFVIDPGLHRIRHERICRAPKDTQPRRGPFPEFVRVAGPASW